MKDRQSTTLNERDSLFDMLSTEKRLMSLYTYAIAEGTEKAYRKELFSCLQSVAEEQLNLFEQLDSRNYYEVEEAGRSELEQKRESLSKLKN
ncbi:MAG: spore coat protein [Clostridia bacterium]|nr:spore coat protein [Clostridia bacterium]